MSMRSITPSSSCSEPIGISVATTCWPKACFRESRLRKKSARSRSSMFTKIVRARPRSEARSQSRLVVTSTPITPLTTKTALSQTRSAARASATKLGSPGVSIRLILRSSQRKEERPAEIDISRAFSSDAASETVVPSATEPSRLIAPAVNRSASFTDVFPLPRWPTKATLRILLGDSCAIRLLSRARARRLLRESGVQRLVHFRHALDVGEHEHAHERRGLWQHEPELLAAPAEPPGEVEQHLDRRRVEVAAAVEIHDQGEGVVRHGDEELVADAGGVRHVDLSAQMSDDGPAPPLDGHLGRCHAARRLLILMTVPSGSLVTSTSSISPSMILSPRPRWVPRRSRQLPLSRTTASSVPFSKLSSTSKVASTGP